MDIHIVDGEMTSPLGNRQRNLLLILLPKIVEVKQSLSASSGSLSVG